MEVKVKLGCDDEGILQAIDVYTLSNTGAYGEHGPTTVGLSGHKSIPLYGTPKAFRFAYDVVYTNRMSAGAYRGYGATQGIFAVESAIDELAAELHMDPVKLREKNMIREGQVMPAYYGETAESCTLDRCVDRVKEMIGWDEKYPRKDMGNGKVRGVGIAMAMQGSSISKVDVASVTIKVNDDGFYSMTIGASDMGTGCDTTLAQVAAECLNCEMDDIVVYGVDTDISPYDSGSYASSTAYLTGNAVVKTCETLKKKIIKKAAEYLSCGEDELEFTGKSVKRLTPVPEGSGFENEISLLDIGNRAMCFNNEALQATESCTSPVSPPPFMAGAAEVEVDMETGQIDLVQFVSAVDCGTPLNENLARVQTEGGLVQGIGMALYEDVTYLKNGHVCENSLMQYKLPTRLDIGRVQVELECSYEPTGPFGAKSIGEIVINTPSPAIANAVYNAVGVRIRELPITAEKIFNGLNQ
jgi:CO/xanthine dehydrogenase Mo-binding subunit